MLHRKHNMKTYLHAYINIIASPISNIALVSSRKGVKLESENHGIPFFFENFLFHDVNAQLIRNIFGYKEFCIKADEKPKRRSLFMLEYQESFF